MFLISAGHPAPEFEEIAGSLVTRFRPKTGSSDPKIAVVKPRNQWSYAGHPYLSGEIESNDFKDAGDWSGARRILMELCQADLRCLDAHAHLPNFVFDRMLRLNPTDNQGVRFRIDEVRAQKPWMDEREKR